MSYSATCSLKAASAAFFFLRPDVGQFDIQRVELGAERGQGRGVHEFQWRTALD
jgi:hypothetical protein